MYLSIKDILVHIYALACTFILIYTVQRSLIAIRKFKRHRLNSSQCCKILNKITLFKTIVHIQLPFVLLLTGHPYIYLIHLPALSWSWTSLPSVRYARNNIRRPRVVALYRKNLLILLGFFSVASTFHGIPLADLVFQKVAEWGTMLEEQLRAVSDRDENLLFGSAKVALIN